MSGGFLQKVFGTQSGENSSNAPAENTSQTSQDQQSNQTTNPKDNVDNQNNIWENPTNNQDNPNVPENQTSFAAQQAQVQQQQSATTPQEQFAAHVDSLNLTNNIDLDKLQADMQTGDTTSLSDAFKQVAANTYKATMLQMNELVDSKITQAKADTEKAASDNWNADLAVREMNTKLPFTSDPNISPIATAVLNRFISKGDSVESAIKSTQDFFASTAEKINGASMPPANSAGSGNFANQNSNQNSNNNNQADSHDEWLDVLAQS